MKVQVTLRQQVRLGRAVGGRRAVRAGFGRSGPTTCAVGSAQTAHLTATRVTLVVDDLATTDPWSPRGLEVRGDVELVDGPGR
jgi:hypothetical protein